MHRWVGLYTIKTVLYMAVERQSRRGGRLLRDELVRSEALELESVNGGHVRFEGFVDHAVAVEERLGREGLGDDGDGEGCAAAGGDVVDVHEG